MFPLLVSVTLAGVLLVYLASPNQRWLASPLRVWPWRVLAWTLTVCALALWIGHTDIRSGLFVSLTLLMLLSGVLPLLSLLRAPIDAARENRREGETLMAKTTDHPLQPDWWSKSLAGAIAGLALAFAMSGLIALLVPGSLDAPDIAQFAMWIVPPIWMTVFAFVYLFRDGARAWWWLAGANLLAYAALFAVRG